MSKQRDFIRLWIVVSVLAAAGAPAALGQMSGPPGVRVQPAVKRQVARSLEFTGAFEPWRTIDLSSEVAGLVTAIPIEEGQTLAAGDLVCRLADDRVQIDVTRAQAAVAESQAQVDQYEAGYRKEDIEAAQRQLEEAQARAERADQEWQRQKPLVEQGILSSIEGSRLKTAADEARSAVAGAQANLDRYRKGYRPQEIEVARAQLAGRQADLNDARWQLQRHTIEAPMAAVVVERLKEPGEWVSVGDPVARLVVLDPLKVRVDVPQVYLNKVRTGQVARLAVDGVSALDLEAKVTQILPQAAAGSRNFPVLLSLPNPDGKLRAGLFTRIKLNIGEPAPTVMVPRQAIMIRGGELTVLVADRISQEQGGPAPGAAGAARGAPPAAAGRMQGMAAAPSPDAMLREVVVKSGTEVGDLVGVDPVSGGPIKPGDLVVTLGGLQFSTGVPVRFLNKGELSQTPPADAATSATQAGR